jgi:hypothetical protein
LHILFYQNWNVGYLQQQQQACWVIWYESWGRGQQQADKAILRNKELVQRTRTTGRTDGRTKWHERKSWVFRHHSFHSTSTIYSSSRFLGGDG